MGGVGWASQGPAGQSLLGRQHLPTAAQAIGAAAARVVLRCVLLPNCSLEATCENRQSMVQRVTVAQKVRDSLAGDKEAAEAYLAKERECLGQRSVLAQVLASQAKVTEGGVAAWAVGLHVAGHGTHASQLCG